MNSPGKPSADWMRAFLPIGQVRDGSWEPRGGAVLLVDQPLVWLVTARSVLEACGEGDVATWVPGKQRSGLLNVSESQQRTGTAWVHHPVGLSATMFPLDADFDIKAFAETQSTKVRDVEPLQPTASLGCIYSGLSNQGQPVPAVLEGIVSAVDKQSGLIVSSSPLLPRNVGAPLLLASPHGGAVMLAGILLETAWVGDADPRVPPLRLSQSICIDAAFELVRGKQATEQRRRILDAGKRASAGAAPAAQAGPPDPGSDAPGEQGEA